MGVFDRPIWYYYREAHWKKCIIVCDEGLIMVSTCLFLFPLIGGIPGNFIKEYQEGSAAYSSNTLISRQAVSIRACPIVVGR
jgi:hypothetical protein